MVDMADNPKLDMEESLGTQKISVLDHLKGFEYRTDKSENFVIDMENFSHGGISNKDMNNNNNPNSRITLQRSLSRKGSSRGGGGSNGGGGSDTPVPASSSSPRAAALVGSSMPEKATLVAAVPADHSINNPHTHHQITINTTSSNIMNTSSESRFAIRRNSFKRPPFSWAIDPKRVLFFFATLSSMGTILLIYFTLSIGKFGDEDTGLG
ncbi:hypothetical protein M5689_002542 [Euphorbia peplus]|nr:hypothetical protein M5689_002542 [Euphorbia peplus]